jgi:ribonuclease HII
METYHTLYPDYNFTKNKGYPTKDHKIAIREYGISPIHRKTFRGVKEYLVQ